MKNTSDNNVIGIVTLVLVILILVLGLTGKFPSAGQNQVVAPAPVAVVPTPTPVPQPAQPTPPPAPANAKIAVADFEAFYKKSFVKGNVDAKVTVIEFSDFECPFCKRHSTSNTLDQVQEKYGDDVNVVFTHFPLSFHPLAPKAQEAAECVGEQGGVESFYAFKTALYLEPKPTRASITKVASAMDGIDATAVETCIDAGTYTQKVADAMSFGRKLGVTGTPGNIVVNNETGEYQKVSGAVPASAFDGPISQYVN